MGYKKETKLKKTEIGLIPEDWEILKISNICDISSSKRIFFREYVKNGIPFYRSKEIILKSRDQEIKDLLFITNKKYKEIKDKYDVPQEGEILLTSVGTLGIPYLVGDNDKFYFKDGNLTWFKNFEEVIDNEFLYYWLKSDVAQKQIDNITIGSTQKALTIDSLKDMNIALPCVDEQNTISKIFSDLDKKIKINNRIIKILEQISQALFKHWFIDFEFPDEQGRPYKSSGGEFVDSEFGKIPKGWNVGVLNNFNIKLISGNWGSEKYSNKNSLEINCIRGTDLAEISIGRLINLPKRFVDPLSIENSLLRNGDIVMEISGGSPTQSTGRVLFISKDILKFYNNKLICSNFCKIIRSSNIFKSYYLYNLLKLLYRKGIFFNFEGGTTGIKNLDFKFLFSKYKVVIPDIKTIEKFFYDTYKLILGVYNNAIQNDILSQIRDTLLPKLITGKIRVNLEDIKEG